MLSFTAFCSGITTLKAQKLDLRKQITLSSGNQKVKLLLELAELNSDSLATAETISSEALQYALRHSDKYWVSRSYTSIAAIKQMNGSPKDSVKMYLLKAEQVLKGTGQNKLYPEYYYEKAKYLYRADDLEAATAAASQAITSAIAQKNTLVLAHTYLLMARIRKQQGNSGEFVENLMQAEKYFRQCSNKSAAGRALISIGLLYHDSGMTDIAQKIMVRATHLCELTSDSLYLAYLYCNTSGVYKTGTDNNQPYHILMRAVAIFKKLKNDKGLGYAQNMLGLYYLELKKYDEAETWFRKTIQSKTRCGDWQGACFAACNIADLNLLLNKFDPVVHALVEAKTYMQNAGDKLSEIVYYNTLGRFNQQDKNYTEALTNLNRSLALARQTHDANFYLSNLKSISDLYHAMGDESTALDYFRRYSAASDSVRNANSPFVQQEIKNELNTDELIARAVKERESRKPDYTGSILKVAVIAVIILLISLSVSAFGNKPANPPISPSDQDKVLNAEKHADKEIVVKLNEHIQQSIWERIENAMTENKYYLRQDLTLHELASHLETNTLYVSKIINARTRLNFNMFVNQYRIEEACRLLLDEKKQHMSIEGIAFSSGFKSKSAFNSAFRKLKGTTPSEFIEKQKQSA